MITLEEELKIFYEISQVLSEAGLEPEPATGTPETADEPDATVGNVGMQRAYSPEETALMTLAAAREQAGGDQNNAAYKSALQAAQNAIVPVLMQGSKRIPSSLLKRGDRDDFVNSQFIKPGFADTLAGLGDKLRSGQPANINSFFTTALINSAKDVSKQRRKEKNVGGDDDAASSDPVINKASSGEAPDDSAERQDDIKAKKALAKSAYGIDVDKALKDPAYAQQAQAQAQGNDAPDEAPPASAEAPAGEEPAPAEAPAQTAPASKSRGKKADLSLPPMDQDSFDQAVKLYSEMPKSTGKPITHNGKDYGILVDSGNNALKNPATVEKLIKAHLLSVDPKTGKATLNFEKPTSHHDIYAGDPHYQQGSTAKPDNVKKQMATTIKGFKKFLLRHYDLSDAHEGRAQQSISLATYQKNADAAAAAAAADPSNPEKAQAAKQAQDAHAQEAKRRADEMQKSKEHEASLLSQHGNDAARAALAKKAKAAKQPTAKAAAAVAPADASAPAEPTQAAPPVAAAPSLADTPDSVDLAPDAPAPAVAAPTEQPKKTKAPKIPDSERALRQQTNDPNASFTVVPEYETERAKKFTRTAVPSAKAEPRRPEERQAHHVAGDLADAEAEFADLPPEHQHAMHPVGRKLASKIDQLHKEYKGIRNTGQKLTRSKEKLKLAKKTPVAMPAPAPKPVAAPDPNAAPDSPAVDYSLHGANPNESRSLAGRIFNEDLTRTYRIVSERIAKYLSRS